MPDAKGTYNSPSAQGWATVLPSGPNFMGMATAMQKQELRKQLAEQAAAEKRRADREKGVSELLKSFEKPITTAQPFQEMISSGFKELQENMAKGIATGRDLSDIRSETAIRYQELSGEAKAGKDLVALINGVDAMNKGKDYQKYNIGAIKADLANKFIGPDGKMFLPSQIRIEDLMPDRLLYGQGSAGAKYLNKQDVVNSFANSDAMKEISVKWRNSPSQSRSGGMLTTTTTGFNQKAKPFQVLDIDKQGKVKVGIMSPEQLLESGVYLAAANDKDMGLLIDAAADEFFAKRLVPPTEQEREYEEARILGEMLTGQVGGASYDRFMSSKTSNLPGSGSGKQTQGEKDDAAYVSGMNTWQSDLAVGDKSALDYLNTEMGISEDAKTALVEAIGAPTNADFIEVKKVDAQEMARIISSSNSEIVDNGVVNTGVYGVFENKRGKKYVPINPDLLGEFGRQIYGKVYKRTGRNYKQELPPVGASAQQPSQPFSIFKNKK